MSSSERLYQQHAFEDLDRRFGGDTTSAPPRAAAAAPDSLDELDARFGSAPAAPLPKPALPAPRASLTTPTTAAADASTRAPAKPRDLQRTADPLERMLNALSTPLYATSGALRGAVDRDYAAGPLEGAARGVREQHTYGDWLESAIPGEYQSLRVPAFVPLPGGPLRADGLPLRSLAHLAGLPLDVGLDPVTYLGGGLSKAGELAHAEEIARRYTALHGVDDAARAAARTAPDAIAAELPARIRAGHEGLQLGGRVVAPELQARALEGVQAAGRSLASSPVARALDPLTEKLSGLSDAGRAVFQLAPELQGIDRDVYLQRLAEKRAAASRAVSEMERDTRPVRDAIAEVAKQHALPVRGVRRAMADAVELAQIPPGTDLAHFMSAGDAKLYARAQGQGNTATVSMLEQRAMPRAQAYAVARAVRQAVHVHLGAAATAARSTLRPALRELVTKINAINATAIANTRAAGVQVSELDDVVNYLRRQMTPEGRRAMDQFGPKEFKGIGRQVTEKHGEQAQRAFRGMTTTQINDLARAGKLSILGNHPVPAGLFHEDPFVATAFRVQHASDAIENATILKDYAQLYGQSAMTAPKGWAHVPSDLPELAATVFPPDIAAALTRQHEGLKHPNEFLRAWDDVHRVWKKYTLPIIPAYHGRNEIGDVWNAVVLGGMNPRWFDPSTSLLFSKGGPSSSVRLGAKTYRGAEILDLAQRAGAINTGQVASIARDFEVLKQAPEGVLRQLGDFVDHNAAIEWAQRFGEARENTTRLALFMDRIAKGYSPQAAALEVKKFLFHYGQVTSDEKSIMRLVPFYQWTRNNVPLQLEYLWRKPGAANFYQHARDEAAMGRPLAAEGEPLPRFLAEGLPFPAGTNREGNPQFMRGESVIPLADLEMFGDPAQYATQVLSPYIKAPFEYGKNVDLFRSDIPNHMERLERAPGEASNYLGMSMPRRAQPLVDLIPGARLATELDRMNPFQAFGTDNEGPMWNRGLPRDYPDPDPALRLLRVIGARPYSYRPDQAAKSLDRDVRSRRRELEQLRDDALDRGNTHNADQYQRELDRLEDQPERARQ